jgi:4-diphosphocytidyl-2-C-methyl-D-erythritol kinase
MTGELVTLAPAKINVCLFLGPVRHDGRHELVSVMQPVSLADRLTLVSVRAGRAGPGEDEVRCPDVGADNLAATALTRLRAAGGWDGPPLVLTIDKRIPVAAGLAGGSADAGAALRLAATVAGLADDALALEVATGLGADVPAQVRPGRVLATGAGERIEPLPGPPPYGVLVLPSRHRLSTAAVYREADRLGLPRDAGSLADRLAAVRAALPELAPDLVVNDLEPAARSLCPAIDEALAQARAAGADVALVSGSGPTVLGLFHEPGAAKDAAQALAGHDPAPIACRPVGREFAAVTGR